MFGSILRTQLNKSTRLSRSFSTLLIADSKQGKLAPANLNALAAAQKLGKPIDVLILDSEDIKEAAMSGEGVKQIFVGVSPSFANATADVYAHGVNAFINSNKGKYTHVISAGSTWAKDYFPRVAAVNDAQPVTDVIEILDGSTFRRPIYAGNAIATVKSKGPLHFLLVRPTNFEAVKVQSAATTKTDGVALLQGLPANVATWVKDELKKSERPELAGAKIVVSGGRAMKNKENFKILEDLADVLGDCAIGASRAAVDAGYCPNDMQVGQTGKIVAPQLYVAVGISGAIQHVAGMKDSKVGLQTHHLGNSCHKY
jgi:electron transfer flavoprotein alpha subunit